MCVQAIIWFLSLVITILNVLADVHQEVNNIYLWQNLKLTDNYSFVIRVKLKY